jgi:NADP-dependent 3-hydroxy acid dehydrogenase YdfG
MQWRSNRRNDVTGSSRGLGSAFAEAALASDFQVAATARNTEDLEELKDKYGDLVLPLSRCHQRNAGM